MPDTELVLVKAVFGLAFASIGSLFFLTPLTQYRAARQDLSLAPQLVRRFTWRGILYTLAGGGLAWASHRMIAALLVALVFMALGVMHLWHARGLRRLLRSESGG